MSKKLIFLIFTVIILAGAGIAYLVVNDPTAIAFKGLKDTEYGFQFADITGWRRIDPRQNAYLSLATLENETVVSYADVRPIDKRFNLPLDEEAQQLIANLCAGVAEQYGASDEVLDPVEMNNVTGYRCLLSTTNATTGQSQTFMQYILVGPADHARDYIITISHPSDDLLEATKATSLVNSFSVL